MVRPSQTHLGLLEDVDLAGGHHGGGPVLQCCGRVDRRRRVSTAPIGRGWRGRGCRGRHRRRLTLKVRQNGGDSRGSEPEFQ